MRASFCLRAALKHDVNVAQYSSVFVFLPALVSVVRLPPLKRNSIN